MKYLLWIVAWIVSQRIMMGAGIINHQGFFSTVFSAIFSVIAVLFARESKIILIIACTLITIWCINCIFTGDIVNGVVGGLLNGILLIMALRAKHK